MNWLLIYGAVIPLMATFFIPLAIRNPETGEYLGFKNHRIAFYFVLIVILVGDQIIEKFGYSLESFIRVSVASLLPFIGGYLFVIYSHKQLFGESFERNKKGD